MSVFISLRGVDWVPLLCRGLRVRHYAVVPIAYRAGLIQWVSGTIPVFQVYKKWQQRAKTREQQLLDVQQDQDQQQQQKLQQQQEEQAKQQNAAKRRGGRKRGTPSSRKQYSSVAAAADSSSNKKPTAQVQIERKPININGNQLDKSSTITSRS